MTVRVERSFAIDASPDAVWEFIADPAQRARAISVVDRFERRGDTTIWHIALPIPLLGATIRVRTKDVERDEPRYVKFTGTSSAFSVTGEHTITAADDGSTVRNVFYVDGKAPGVERFFERNFAGEITNLQQALQRHLRED